MCFNSTPREKSDFFISQSLQAGTRAVPDWRADCETLFGNWRIEMRYLKLAVPAVIVGVGIFVNASSTFAKPQYSKETKKGCTYCHTTAKGGKNDADLTAAGKYYKEHKSLEGFTGK
jgi:hypothetical protein